MHNETATDKGFRLMTIHEFKHCIGCGNHAHKRNAVVALPGPVYICDECIIIAVSILASELKVDARIGFVDAIQVVMQEPYEIVAKWKEAKAKKALEDEYDARD